MPVGPVLVSPAPDSVPLASLGKPSTFSVMVTVSLAPTSGSLMVTPENGRSVWSSLINWPATVPVITGGSFTAVAPTEVVLLVVGRAGDVGR